ncbi:MAG: diguanylate cyclase [Alkalibacterium sp.]|nr:diguanylate cyclase [Alkalibacterium sp.]
MTIQRKNKYWLGFIVLFTSFYYAWIILFQNSPSALTWGGNWLSLTGSLVPGIWLLKATRRSKAKDKVFWFLLTVGTFSYFIAEFFWILYESFLGLEVPYPGISDVFYIFNVLFYISAFVYKLHLEKRHLVLMRYVFDILLIMTMFATFSWYFILEPIIAAGDVSQLAIALSLFYPIADLALVLCVLILYFTGQKVFSHKMLLFYSAGLITYIIADTAFVYLISFNDYFSGSWTDPLFILGVMLIGYTGLLQKEGNELPAGTQSMLDGRLHLYSVLFPYISLTVLFLFMIITTTGVNAVIIGVGLSVAFVMIRQYMIIADNQTLLKKYYKNVEQLETNQERYQSLFDHHPDAAFSFNLNGVIESVNKKGAEILVSTPSELLGRPLLNFIHPDYQETVKEHFINAKNGIFKYYELPLTNKSNEFYYLSITHVPIKSNNEVVGVYAIARDVTENKINQEQIQYMAFHDHLTHLANRICFEDVLKNAITDAQDNHKKFALLFMDLNNFKTINDEYGHAFGDSLLAEVAARIKSMVSEPDYAARLGGDEFTLLIDNLDSYDEAMRWASQLLNRLNQTYIIDGYEVLSTPSVGFAYYPRDGQTVQELLNKADSAMYENKRHSKAI